MQLGFGVWIAEICVVGDLLRVSCFLMTRGCPFILVADPRIDIKLRIEIHVAN